MTKQIKIGIDIRDLRIARTGAKTYLEELCNVFKIKDPAYSFVLIDTFLPVYTGKIKWLKLIEHCRFVAWKQFFLPFIAYSKSCDVLFCTDFFVPYFSWGIKTIPVFHDAFVWEYPEHYNHYWLKLFYQLGVGAAKKSPFIITPSLYTKERIGFYLAIDPSKIITVYEAPKKFASTKQAINESISPEFDDIFASPYLLHVGTFEKRKNLPVLIKAFHQLHSNGHRDLKIVLLGQASPKKDMDDAANIHQLVLEKGLTDAVLMPGYVSDQLLAKFYQHALIYVFPSRNEGFGIPVLEAFAYGLPVIIANNSCLPEIAGDAALSFDPADESALYEKFQILLSNEDLRKEMSKKALERLSFFSWEKAAKELKSIFRKAVSG